MSTLHPLPKETFSHEILAMLYGQDLALTPAEPLAADSGRMVAVYINDDNQPVSACICDYNFAAFAGAALTMIPVGGAEDAAQTGEFSEIMLGNIHEVMNIFSRLFMDNNSPHLKLDKVYTSLQSAPAEAHAMIEACQGRADFSVDISRYGSGRLSFVTT